jgi:hypothetical protein
VSYLVYCLSETYLNLGVRGVFALPLSYFFARLRLFVNKPLLPLLAFLGEWNTSHQWL